jgi:hypothetical protein
MNWTSARISTPSPGRLSLRECPLPLALGDGLRTPTQFGMLLGHSAGCTITILVRFFSGFQLADALTDAQRSVAMTCFFAA